VHTRDMIACVACGVLLSIVMLVGVALRPAGAGGAGWFHPGYVLPAIGAGLVIRLMNRHNVRHRREVWDREGAPGSRSADESLSGRSAVGSYSQGDTTR